MLPLVSVPVAAFASRRIGRHQSADQTAANGSFRRSRFNWNIFPKPAITFIFHDRGQNI
jgi:hypothetical protein